MGRHLIVVAVLFWPVPAALLQAAPQTADRIRQAFADDVHAKAGVTCASCHVPADGARAGATATEATDYAIARPAIAPLCARCHSDAAYIRQFRPQARVDEYAQYLTSTHGKRMRAGETRVATCTDCHGAHGIRPVSDPRSPIAPRNVAGTCARCHGDAARMRAFDRDSSPPGDWSASVHAVVLLERGDTSAPTCSTCHGSHGAAPPGVSRVADVCAQCHVRETELFRGSPKKAIFDAIDQAECVVCHSNHRIEHPRDSWVGLQKGAICATCHDESTGGADTITAVRAGLDAQTASRALAEALLDRALTAGMLIDEGRRTLQESTEHLIQSRVLVHAFRRQPFEEMAAQGLEASNRARRVGEEAMTELRFRRTGLAVATLLILGFLVTLGIKIRRLPMLDQ
jgi:predicted CXXCH cytochrome family protein